MLLTVKKKSLEKALNASPIPRYKKGFLKRGIFLPRRPNKTPDNNPRRTNTTLIQEEKESKKYIETPKNREMQRIKRVFSITSKYFFPALISSFVYFAITLPRNKLENHCLFYLYKRPVKKLILSSW